MHLQVLQNTYVLAASAAAFPTRLSARQRRDQPLPVHQGCRRPVAQQEILGIFLAMYRECARLTAGILGRLHGKKKDDDIGEKPDIYRSGSIRTQVQLSKNDINDVRAEFKMLPLDA
jgi:hypothetical protein